jgi:hypothetical protein
MQAGKETFVSVFCFMRCAYQTTFHRKSQLQIPVLFVSQMKSEGSGGAKEHPVRASDFGILSGLDIRHSDF